MNKILVFGDGHFPYQDNRAIDCMMKYAKSKYKPNTIVMVGDMVDFYGLSTFDRNPNRTFDIQYEVNLVKKFFGKLRKNFPKVDIYYLEGNHSSRLKKLLVRKAPELLNLDVLRLDNILEFSKYNIKFVGGDMDYWKKDTGHLKLNDTIFMHGDNRLNGARGGKYAAINTMTVLNHNLIMGHTHKLGLNYYTNHYVNFFSLNTGCLCQIPGMADWHQGFGTFEIKNGVSINPHIYHINNGVLFVDGVKYVSRLRSKKL